MNKAQARRHIKNKNKYQSHYDITEKHKISRAKKRQENNEKWKNNIEYQKENYERLRKRKERIHLTKKEE